MTGPEIAALARTWLGTPFRHQGRGAAGLDCVGLVLVVAQRLGLFADLDPRDYGRIPDGQTLAAGCARHLAPAPQPAAGDVLLLRFAAAPQHLAIAGDYPHGGLSIIHAWAVARRVVEHRLDALWSARIVSAWRFPGVGG